MVRIFAEQDADGDVWVGSGLTGSRLACLHFPAGTKAFVTDRGLMRDEVDTNYGPLVRVVVDITVTTVAKAVSDTCDDCLYDRHFCFRCDDVVDHFHVHEGDDMASGSSNFDSQRWAAHVAAQRKAQERVTPLLAEQTKNAPKK